MKEPLSPGEAKALIHRILDSSDGEVTIGSHAQTRMKERNLDSLDCVNVLRGGYVEPAQFEHGTWRYPVRTRRVCVVIAFRSTRRLSIVTAWRVDR